MDKTDNEILAEFMGFPLTKEESTFRGGWKTVPFMQWRFNSDWNQLMDVWYKFRDLDTPGGVKAFTLHCGNIEHAIVHEGISESFSALVEAVKWYNGVKK